MSEKATPRTAGTLDDFVRCQELLIQIIGVTGAAKAVSEKHDDLSRQIGEILKNMRVKSRLSLRKAAAQIGVSFALLNDMEIGRRRWQNEYAQRAASLYSPNKEKR